MYEWEHRSRETLSILLEHTGARCWEKQLPQGIIGWWGHPKCFCRRKKPILFSIPVIRKPRTRALSPFLGYLPSLPQASSSISLYLPHSNPTRALLCRYLLAFSSFWKLPWLLSCCTGTTARRFSPAGDSRWSLIL